MKKIFDLQFCIFLASLCVVSTEGIGQMLIADFRFNDSYGSAVGSPPNLELLGNGTFSSEAVDGVQRRVLSFEAGSGLGIPSASSGIGDAYTIAMLFKFESTGGYRRLIDFKNRTTDWGLYSLNGKLNFYSVAMGTRGAIAPGQFVQVVLTRGLDGNVRGFVNKVQEIGFNDSGGHALVTANGSLSFFQDDLVRRNEHSAGAVARIRIWDGPLSEAAVESLDLFAGEAPTSLIQGFDPPAATPGTPVSVIGQNLQLATSVSFGGVAADFELVDRSRIISTVPTGALSGPIALQVVETTGNSTIQKTITSLSDFHVAVPPVTRSLQAIPSTLVDFSAVVGSASDARQITINAVGLDGPLQVEAPAGFEISRNGINYSTSLQIAAPMRTDTAANYPGAWVDGSNGGSGFQAWAIRLNADKGQAAASIGNPASSEIAGMGTEAFSLQASPEKSGATAAAERRLDHPLAIGETLAFDWGTNWDASQGEKGFSIFSGSARVLQVTQNGYPGLIYLLDGNQAVETGLAYGNQPMRWKLQQTGPLTLRVSATSRLGGADVAFSRDISVPGAVNGFSWKASEMPAEILRVAYFNALSIEPAEAGGGALGGVTLHVRMAPFDVEGAKQGSLSFSRGGQPLGGLALAGEVHATEFGKWTSSFGLDFENGGLPGADPDGDGHTNQAEFLFGGHPLVGDGSLVRFSQDGENMNLSFMGRRNGTTYRLLATTDLSSGPWVEHSAALLDSATPEPTIPLEYIQKEASFPRVGGKLFLRLQAQENP